MRTRLLLAPVVALALLAAGCGGDDDDDRQPGAGIPPTQGERIAKESALAEGPSRAYQPSGKVVADSGFRPERDGFGFENYGEGYNDLGAAQMEELFGPRVCASRQGTECVLTPPAQQWMNTTNTAMKGGHCFGMAVSASMMFDRLLNPLDYGGAAVPALNLAGNLPLQGRIALTWALQATPIMQIDAFQGTPNQVLDRLTAGFKTGGDTYTLGFFRPDWTAGHAVTPYGVEDKGGGKSALLMYDNNHPGVTRAMEFDRNQNSWSYEAATNPDVQSYLYTGNATTQTQFIFRNSIGVGRQPCPFCVGPAAQIRGRSYERVSLTADPVNHAHMLLTDDQGRRTGYVGRRFVNEIPGVRAIPVLTNQNWRLRPEPMYLVPTDVKYAISLDAGRLKGRDSETVSVIGPGYSASVSGIDVRPRDRHAIDVSAGGAKVTYGAARRDGQSPDIALGFDRAGSDSEFTVASRRLTSGARLTATANPVSGRLGLTGAGAGRSRAVVGYDSIRRSGARTERTQAVPLAGRSACDFRSGGRACRSTR